MRHFSFRPIRTTWKLITVLALLAVSLFGQLLAAQANHTPAPVLLVVNSAYAANPFGNYLGEILRAEGLNAYDTVALSALTAADLAQHDVTILAETTLSAAQASLFTAHVSGGGRLMAMRPDPQIAGLFGLGAASGALTDGYLKFNATQPAAQGLTTSVLQIHGVADQYALSGGATAIALLYSNASTPTVYPAASLSANGQAVAFTYDLARNVVYTRQGNPANANKIFGSPAVADAQGIFGTWDAANPPVTRTTSLFQLSNVLAAPAWIDRNLIPVPQADEQQRLFARLVQQLVNGARPLPQLWYFPGTAKTMLILTGDAHANPSTFYQQEINSLNTYGAKLTFYISIASNPTDTQMQAWRAQGYEFGIHPYAYKPDTYPPFNITNLSQGYDVYTSWFGMQYTSPKSRTVRNHQIAWQGWTDAANFEVAHNIALDTNFYHWGTWLRKADGTWPHGYITGSGRPMKFIGADGTLVPVYQHLTELVDEQLVLGAGDGFEGLSNAGAVAVSQQLIDASLAGDYAALMTQFHVDYYGAAQTWAEQTVAYAVNHSVPVWNADQWLAFTETRNDANFSDVGWSGNTLTFNLAATATTGVNLATLLPLTYNGLNLQSVLVDGQSIAFATQAIKGVNTAFVTTASGNHTFSAVYQAPGPTPTATNTPVPPTATNTALPTNTPTVGPSPTATTTPVPPTATNTALSPTATNTPVSPTSAFTPTPVNTSLTHTTYADFGGACTVQTEAWASDVNGGSVTLAGSGADDFSGSALNGGLWASGSWSGGAYGPTLNAGVLTLPGSGYVRSQAIYTRATVEATATFGAGAWQHIGFGSLDFSSNRYFIFSTVTGDGHLYARVNNNTSEQRVDLGLLPTGEHRYRVEWSAVNATTDNVRFLLDGAQVAQMQVASAGAANFYVYLSNNGAAALAINRAQALPPYAANGAYTSCALDAGAGNEWQNIQWDAVVPAHTGLNVDVRVSTDGAAWGAWINVPLSGSTLTDKDRFVQYRLSLNTTDAQTAPVINAMTLGYGLASVLPTATPLPPTNTPTATFTSTPAPPTATNTPTPLPPTDTPTPLPPTNTPTATFTSTPAPPTATNTPTSSPPTDTPTPLPPTDTPTPLPPTNTPTATFTSTPAPPTATNTPTSSPPTDTLTPLPPTDTPTPLPPTDTLTPLPPTDTLTLLPPTDTLTPLPPTDTPTATFTSTPAPPTATFTPLPTNTPTATTTPAPQLIFADGFEAGNFSMWSASVTDAGSLSVSTAAALAGTRGMQALINDNNSIYVTDNRPVAESKYRARFNFDPNTLTMTNGNAHYLLYAYDAASNVVMQLELRRSGSLYQLRVGARNNSTGWTYTNWAALTDAPHMIQIDWLASTAAGALNGSLTFQLDGVTQGALTSLNNNTRRIESVRLGAVSGIDTGTRGTYFFDEFESYRILP